MSDEWAEVILDFQKALEDGDDYDVIVKAGEDPDVKEFRVHSFVLRARCSYFKKALSRDWEKRGDDGKYIFEKSNIPPNVFQLILRQVNDLTPIIRRPCSRDLKLFFLFISRYLYT